MPRNKNWKENEEKQQNQHETKVISYKIMNEAQSNHPKWLKGKQRSGKM